MALFHLNNYLSNFYPVSEEARNAVLKIAEFRECPAKTILLQEGQVQKHIFYLNKGLARGFYHMADREITLWICYEPDTLGSSDSFFNQVPSDINIETIEPCQLVVLPREQWLELYDKFPEVERVSRLISQSNVQKLYRRIKILHYSSPEEKYRYLIENESQIIQRTPLKFIASYLNITPETLSRIRAKIVL